jgi:hypothetical protein
MAITTVDLLVAAAKQVRPYYKASATSKGAGSYHSLWTVAGLPGAGAAAGTAAGAACDNTTVGAHAFTSPGGANLAYLAALELAGATQGNFILYDRLVHTSTLSGIVTTAQTVGSAALTRYTTGEDVECFLEFYSPTGATAVTATISYTNEAGTAGRSGSAAVVATTVAGQLIPVTLQAGDKGVRSVQSVTLSASTLTAGNFGITLVRRLAHVPNMVANIGATLDFGDTGLPQIVAGACLGFMVLCTATNTGVVTGSIKTAEG